MELLPAELKLKLLENGRNREKDHWPVVKFFNPTGAGTWLITELHEDGDTLFGLADLGVGCPELGSVSLSELREIKLRFGLGIERDAYWKANKPISQYAEDAREAGHIIA